MPLPTLRLGRSEAELSAGLHPGEGSTGHTAPPSLLLLPTPCCPGLLPPLAHKERGGCTAAALLCSFRLL